MKRAITALSIVLLGCGTLDAPGHGDTDLPNNRTGPFRVLASADLDGGSCVLGSFAETYEDPAVVPENNGEFSLYATRVQGSARSIVRVGVDRSLRALGAPEVVLEDPSGVSGPSVVRTADGWVMAFARGGRIDVANGADGHTWTVRATPLLSQDRSAGERSPLSAPSIAREPDGRWVMVYASGDAVWLARGDAADGLFARVDGDPDTSARDPILGGASASRDGGVDPVTRRYDDPVIAAERTSAGRVIWRVYARESSRRVVDGGAVEETAIALAASYDGVRFTRAASLALSGRADPSPAGPAVLFDGPIRTWMFFSGGCGGSQRGLRAAVAPGSAALPIGR